MISGRSGTVGATPSAARTMSTGLRVIWLAVSGRPGRVGAVFDYRHDAALNVECHNETVTAGLSVRELSYDHGAGGRALATLIVPPRPSGTGVIVCHGGTEDGRFWFIPEATQLALQAGMTVLLPATWLPPHGDRRASADAMRVNVLTHRRGLDLLTTWVDHRLNRLGFFGHSGGAFQGAYLSAVEPRLDALVLTSAGAGSLVRLAATTLPPGEPNTEEYLRFLEGLDPVSFVAVPGRRRLLFQHGRYDPVILRPEALRLFEAAAEPRQWREYACAHDTGAYPQAVADRMEFLRNLNQGGGAGRPTSQSRWQV